MIDESLSTDNVNRFHCYFISIRVILAVWRGVGYYYFWLVGCYYLFFSFGNYEILYVCIVSDIHSIMECKLNTLTGCYSPMVLIIYRTIARQCHNIY